MFSFSPYLSNSLILSRDASELVTGRDSLEVMTNVVRDYRTLFRFNSRSSMSHCNAHQDCIDVHLIVGWCIIGNHILATVHPSVHSQPCKIFASVRMISAAAAPSMTAVERTSPEGDKGITDASSRCMSKMGEDYE